MFAYKITKFIYFKEINLHDVLKHAKILSAQQEIHIYLKDEMKVFFNLNQTQLSSVPQALHILKEIPCH